MSQGPEVAAEDLVSVVVYTTRSDAEIARAKLAGEGIEALVMADDEGGLNPGFYARYGVRVLVRADQSDAARLAIGVAALRIPEEAVAAMVQHARFCGPEEACGLFAVGGDGVVSTQERLRSTSGCWRVTGPCAKRSRKLASFGPQAAFIFGVMLTLARLSPTSTRTATLSYTRTPKSLLG